VRWPGGSREPRPPGRSTATWNAGDLEDLLLDESRDPGGDVIDVAADNTPTARARFHRLAVRSGTSASCPATGGVLATARPHSRVPEDGFVDVPASSFHGPACPGRASSGRPP
jgi:hypothetical protein